MIRKIILISILLPLSILIVLIAVSLLYSNSKNIVEYQFVSIILTYALVLNIAYKIKILKINKIKISFKEFIIAVILSLVLFSIFYLEKVQFGNYIKKTPTFFLSFITVILTPVVEEFFNKKIIFDNLITLKFNKFWTIIISSLYFSILHYPNILLIHFLVGLTTSFIYYKGKNILQVILIHISYNFLINYFNYI